jgi:isocitrate dehydrogenase (NAD+)
MQLLEMQFCGILENIEVYPMKHEVTLIPGDGIGPEICDSVKTILAASGVQIDWKHADGGEACALVGRGVMPDETIQQIQKSKVALKGPTTTPQVEGTKVQT